MAVKVIPLVCPNCGGQIHVEDGTERFFCTYCGTQLMLGTDEKRFLFTKHIINEAKMIEAEGQSKAMVIDAKERARVNRMKVRNNRIRAWGDYQTRQMNFAIKALNWEFFMILGLGLFILILKLTSLF